MNPALSSSCSKSGPTSGLKSWRQSPWRARGPLGLVAFSSLLAACSFAPTYERPASAPVADHFQANSEWKTAQPADAFQRGNWWTLYGDDQLNSLEDKVTQANQNLKAAFAQLQQARADVRINRAGYFPTIGANAGSQREHQSTNRALYTPTAPKTYTDNTLTADVSYELDVWGRVRNLVSASKSREKASEADMAALDLATHAELATDYFTLRSLDAAQRVLEESVIAYQAGRDLTRNLYNGGAAPESDLAQAELQYQNAKTQVADTRLQRRQLEHAIAVLVGESATNFSLAAAPQATTPPPVVDPGLPSQLLERRPDVASAERLVAAANAQIGVARVAYFPVFSLGGSFGYESSGVSNWLEAPSRLWSLGPSASFTLFDGGKRHALTDQARAAYDESVANYRQTVLVAYQEVEDNLSALHELESEGETQQAAVTAANTALTQANYRYKGGIVTYLDVVVAQNAALQAQLQAANIVARRMNANVLLVKALGGGWKAHD